MQTNGIKISVFSVHVIVTDVTTQGWFCSTSSCFRGTIIWRLLSDIERKTLTSIFSHHFCWERGRSTESDPTNGSYPQNNAGAPSPLTSRRWDELSERRSPSLFGVQQLGILHVLTHALLTFSSGWTKSVRTWQELQGSVTSYRVILEKKRKSWLYAGRLIRWFCFLQSHSSARHQLVEGPRARPGRSAVPPPWLSPRPPALLRPASPTWKAQKVTSVCVKIEPVSGWGLKQRAGTCFWNHTLTHTRRAPPRWSPFSCVSPSLLFFHAVWVSFTTGLVALMKMFLIFIY